MNLEAQVGAAIRLFDIGRRKESIAEFERLLKGNPEDLDIRHLLSKIYGIVGEKEKQLLTIRGGLKTSKDLDSDEKKIQQVVILKMLGKFHLTAGEHGTTYSESNGMCCYKPLKWSQEEEDKYKKDHYEKALENFKECLKLQTEMDPESIHKVSEDVAVTLQKLERIEEALPYFQKLLLSGLEKHYQYYANALEKLNQPEKFLLFINETMIRMFPRSTFAYAKLEEHYEKTGDLEKSKTIGQKKFFFGRIPDLCKNIPFTERNFMGGRPWASLEKTLVE